MKLTKILFWAGLFFGIYTVQMSYQEGKKHKLFVKDVQEAIYFVDVNWSERKAKKVLLEKVFEVAENHKVNLAEDAVDFRYSRKISTGKERTSMNYRRNDNDNLVMTRNKVTPYTAYITARVTINYARKITLFYTKHFKFTRTNGTVGGQLKNLR